MQQAIRKANGILDFISSLLEFKNIEVLPELCKELVQTFLENCVPFYDWDAKEWQSIITL